MTITEQKKPHAKEAKALPITTKEDIGYVYRLVRPFADAQRQRLDYFEVGLHPGLVAGRRKTHASVAVRDVPGRRYAHILPTAEPPDTQAVCGLGRPFRRPPTSL